MANIGPLGNRKQKYEDQDTEPVSLTDNVQKQNVPNINDVQPVPITHYDARNPELIPLYDKIEELAKRISALEGVEGRIMERIIGILNGLQGDHK